MRRPQSIPKRHSLCPPAVTEKAEVQTQEAQAPLKPLRRTCSPAEDCKLKPNWGLKCCLQDPLEPSCRRATPAREDQQRSVARHRKASRDGAPQSTAWGPRRPAPGRCDPSAGACGRQPRRQRCAKASRPYQLGASSQTGQIPRSAGNGKDLAQVRLAVN